MKNVRYKNKNLRYCTAGPIIGPRGSSSNAGSCCVAVIGPGYYRASPVGEVQISTKRKGDEIFVDGGFAGRTGELKKFPLRAGNHTIELRNANGKTFYQEQINVIAGKKLKIQPDYTG
jgi:hypothetical protein